jgi:nucleoside-diphosphate-sugar epimerase
MILITGGNGVVGSRLALTLQNSAEKVRILGLAPTESDSALRQAGVEVHYGDVTRSKDFESAMLGVDTVFHLAAILSSPENPSRFHAINVGGTRAALEAAKQYGVRHFIFVSSISVTYPRRNAYSTSKAEAEKLVRQSTIPWTIVRPCLVRDGLEYQVFEAAMLRWPVILLPRRGAALKRPISTGDLAEALAKMAGNTKAIGRTIALGGNEIISLRDMAGAMLRTKGLHKTVWPIPEGLLRTAAAFPELLSRILRRKITWLSQQSVDGLAFDAAPEMNEE